MTYGPEEILQKIRVIAPKIVDLLDLVEIEKDKLVSSGKATIIKWTGECRFRPTWIGDMGGGVTHVWTTEIHYKEVFGKPALRHWDRTAGGHMRCDSCDITLYHRTSLPPEGSGRFPFVMRCECGLTDRFCFPCAENNRASCYHCTGQIRLTCHLCEGPTVGNDATSDDRYLVDVDMECMECDMEWKICRVCSSGKSEGSRVGAVVGKCQLCRHGIPAKTFVRENNSFR